MANSSDMYSCYTTPMIARVTGTVVEQSERGIVVETGGIGYLIFSPYLPELGTEITLYTHLVIREDAQELYGFALPEEKKLFSTLIGVSGVGPKTALHMLTLYPLTSLVGFIKNGDAKAISMTPGVGKKTAEKIVIDLKDKLDEFVVSEEEGQKSDLVEALLSLGYKEVHVRTILTNIDGTLPIEKQITSALQLLQK